MNGAQVSADGGGDKAEVGRTSPANATIYPEEFSQWRRSAGDEPDVSRCSSQRGKTAKKETENQHLNDKLAQTCKMENASCGRNKKQKLSM